MKRIISIAAALSIVCTSAFAVGANSSEAQAGQSCYIASQSVKKTALNKTVRTKVALYVHAGAGKTYDVIGSLEQGEKG